MPSKKYSDPTERPLTAKQLRFVEEYLIDFKAFSAAKRAGYCERDRQTGHRLINLPHVRAEVQRRCLDSQVKLEVTGDHIRQGFAQIGFDPRDEATGGPTRLERIAALDKLSKLFGLYIEKHVFTGATLEQLLALAEERDKTLPPASVPLRLVKS